tara:strand:+ start:109963 stop:110931 length:969 start_codon:yes stop_codon:yes gene_type:complete
VFASRVINWARNKLDIGDWKLAAMVWLAVVIIPASFFWVIWYLLMLAHPFLGLVFLTLLLYLSLGFKQYLDRFSNIRKHLISSDVDKAKNFLSDWSAKEHSDPVLQEVSKTGDHNQISREAIKLLVVSLHRNLFSVIFWYLILPGPLGLVAYKFSVLTKRIWSEELQGALEEKTVSEDGEPDPLSFSEENYFDSISKKGFFWFDWISCRVTAFVFAVVGNFEDVVAMIRASSAGNFEGGHDSERIILAAGEGAMTFRLTVPTALSGKRQLENFDSDIQSHVDLRDPDENSMVVASGLMWRSLILFLTILLLTTFGWFANLIH